LLKQRVGGQSRLDRQVVFGAFDKPLVEDLAHPDRGPDLLERHGNDPRRNYRIQQRTDQRFQLREHWFGRLVVIGRDGLQRFCGGEGQQRPGQTGENNIEPFRMLLRCCAQAGQLRPGSVHAVQ
jgi:hypothetical protein